jgi:hypothetical protein
MSPGRNPSMRMSASSRISRTSLETGWILDAELDEAPIGSVGPQGRMRSGPADGRERGVRVGQLPLHLWAWAYPDELDDVDPDSGRSTDTSGPSLLEGCQVVLEDGSGH